MSSRLKWLGWLNYHLIFFERHKSRDQVWLEGNIDWAAFWIIDSRQIVLEYSIQHNW
jgi:hypothetical protein